MPPFREEMPSRDKCATPNPALRPGRRVPFRPKRMSQTSFRLQLLKHRFLRKIGWGEKRVKIVAGQTAELRMIRSEDGSHREPLVFECPICTDRDGVDTKLLMMELQTKARRPGVRARPASRKCRPVLMLVRVTRQQIDDIRDGFNLQPPPPRKPRTDREAVIGSLVP